MPRLKLDIVGTKPLLVANGKMANPLYPPNVQYRRLLASKPNPRTKAVKQNPGLLDEWYLAEERLLGEAAYYYDQERGLHVPSANILHAVYEAFFGNRAATKAGGARLAGVLMVDESRVEFEHDGPSTPEERVNKGIYRVGITTNHAMGGVKVRAIQGIFRQWALRSLIFTWPDFAEEPGYLGKAFDFNRGLLAARLQRQGETMGLGAYRKSPHFGNFTLENVNGIA